MSARYIPCVSVCGERMPWKLIAPPPVERDKFSPGEIVVSGLAKVSLPEGEFLLGQADNRGTVPDMCGVIVETAHLDPFGQVTRPPRPERIAQTWLSDPCSTILFHTPHGATLVQLFQAPENDPAVLRAASRAAGRIVDSWLHDHDLRPIEYARDKWRGGYCASTNRDPERPAHLPRATVGGVTRTTTIYLSPEPNLFAPADLIQRAAALGILPPTMPIREGPRARRGNPFRSVANFLSGRT